jgi:hypothetical protein
VDKLIAARLGFADRIEKDEYALLAGKKLKSKQVVFIGVGELHDFRYGEIRRFGQRALQLARGLIESPRLIAMPIHGPGYGLDESEAFLSLIGGLMDGISSKEFPATLETIEIVERDPQRVVRLRYLLGKALEQHPAQVVKRGSVNISTKNAERAAASPKGGEVVDLRRAKNELADYGAASERKIRVFVAMPFKDDYSDEYDIAITEAAQHVNIVCERIDKEAYVGDVMNQVKVRIGAYHGMLERFPASLNLFCLLGVP